MSQDAQRVAIQELVDQLKRGQITKRTFLRVAMAVGIPMGTALFIAQSCGDLQEDVTKSETQS